MTTEEQIQTLIKSQGGAENAIAYLLAYVEGLEIDLDAWRGGYNYPKLPTLADKIKQMESDNG